MFILELLISSTPEKVFAALTSNVDKWWTTSVSPASAVGEVLVAKFENDTCWEMQVTSIEKNSLVIWKVVKAFHNLDFLAQKDEWENTEIKWQIIPKKNGVLVKFYHKGLSPHLECYDICSSGWGYFLASLKDFLETGKGRPYIS